MSKDYSVPPESKTDRELREMALGIQGGAIFTHWHINMTKGMALADYFMPMALVSKEEYTEMVKVTGLIYEHIEEVKGHIDGCPVFDSMKRLNRPDTETLKKYIEYLEGFENGSHG